MIADFVESETLSFKSGPRNFVMNTKGKLFMLIVWINDSSDALWNFAPFGSLSSILFIRIEIFSFPPTSS